MFFLGENPSEDDLQPTSTKLPEMSIQIFHWSGNFSPGVYILAKGSIFFPPSSLQSAYFPPQIFLHPPLDLKKWINNDDNKAL